MLDGLAFQQIDRASDQLLQFVLDGDDFGEIGRGVGREFDQDIHVAVGVEILADGGAKQGQGLDAMSLTNLADGGEGQVKGWIDHARSAG